MNKIKIDINELGNPIRTKKLAYKGLTDEYKVYRVPINKLFFNDENGRIATYMSQYLNEHKGQNINDLSNEEYNKIISEFIKISNGNDTFKRTLNDIKIKGQLEAGVILDDGRVIDGNRRFTCLRELYDNTKNDKYSYFECVILESPKNENDRKELRTLELNLQYGIDEKVGYEAIDRLVSIYNDLIGNKKIYSPDEYAKKFNIKQSELKKLIAKTEIMIDYLDFIDKPLMFYIARDYKIDGPIQELVTLKEKIDRSEWDRIKICFYFWIKKNDDRTRRVRETINTYNKNRDQFEKLLEELLEQEEEKKINQLKEKFNTKQENKKNDSTVITTKTEEPIKDEESKKNKQETDVLIESVESSKNIESKFFNINYSTKIQEARKKPISTCKQVLTKLESIDLDIVSSLNNEEKEELLKELNNIEQIIQDIKEK